MNFPKGSGVVLGTATGLVIGLLTDNVVSFAFLGLMFGLIGEMTAVKKK